MVRLYSDLAILVEAYEADGPNKIAGQYQAAIETIFGGEVPPPRTPDSPAIVAAVERLLRNAR